MLDVGCGSGSVLELILKKYGCTGIGIDMLDSSVVNCCDKMSYLCADIDKITDYSPAPSMILSVDSLYFSRDLNSLVQMLTNICKRFCFFYSQYLFNDTGDKTALHSGHTALAQALCKAEIPFRAIDFSENEYNLYVNMQRALEKHKHAFAAENNADLYERKLREVNMGLELFDNGLASRYLYMNDTE